MARWFGGCATSVDYRKLAKRRRRVLHPAPPRLVGPQDSLGRGLPSGAEKSYLGSFAKSLRFTHRFRACCSEAWSAALRPCEGAPPTSPGGIPASGSAAGRRSEGGRRDLVDAGSLSRGVSREQDGAILHQQEADPQVVRPHPRSRGYAE